MKGKLLSLGVTVTLLAVCIVCFSYNYNKAYWPSSSSALGLREVNLNSIWSEFGRWGDYQRVRVDSGSKRTDMWIFDFNQSNDRTIGLLNYIVEECASDKNREYLYTLAVETGYSKDSPFMHEDIIEHVDLIWSILFKSDALSPYMPSPHDVVNSPYYKWRREKYGDAYLRSDITLYWEEGDAENET